MISVSKFWVELTFVEFTVMKAAEKVVEGWVL
jgi:hypothetical protein